MLKKILVLTAVIVSFNAMATVNFNNFASTAGLKLNGGTAVVSTTDGQVLRLTKADADQAGSVFSLTTVNASDFSTYFTFRITSPGGTIFDCNSEAGADGLVFVVQPVDSSLGGLGEGIGYKSIPKSVGVEFDTWCNATNNDPSSNHLGIVTNGSVVHQDAASTVKVTPNFDDGEVWHVWIDYNASMLEVRTNQSGVRPTTPTLSKKIDIPAILSGSGSTKVTNAYIGFTSATGLDWGNHDLLSWTYRDAYNPISDPGICSPTTFDPVAGTLTIPAANVPILGAISQYGVTMQLIPSSDGQLVFKVIDAQPK